MNTIPLETTEKASFTTRRIQQTKKDIHTKGEDFVERIRYSMNNTPNVWECEETGTGYNCKTADKEKGHYIEIRTNDMFCYIAFYEKDNYERQEIHVPFISKIKLRLFLRAWRKKECREKLLTRKLNIIQKALQIV